MPATKSAKPTKRAIKANSAPKPKAVSHAAMALTGPNTETFRSTRPGRAKTMTQVDRRSPFRRDGKEFKLFEALGSIKGPERRAQVFQYVAGVDVFQAEAMILNSPPATLKGTTLKATTLNDLASRLAELFGVRKADAAELLGVSISAISRQTPPTSDVLDRTLMVSEVFADVTGVLGTEGAQKWFNTPNRALGDQAPVTLMSSRLGEKRVQRVIGALLDGAYL